MLPIPNENTAYWILGGGFKEELKHPPTEATVEFAHEHKAGLYYVPNELGGGRNEKGNRRFNENVSKALACFADFDKGDKESQMEVIKNCPIPPSVIVESGRGYHAYWALKPDKRLRLWGAIQEAIAKRLGSDEACIDFSRLMRLPDSWHVREGYEPSIVRTVERNESVYSLDDLATEFKPIIRTNGREDIYKMMQTGLKEGSRNKDATKVIGHFIASMPPECAWDAACWLNSKAKPPMSDRELQSIFNSILKRHYVTNTRRSPASH